MEDSRGAAANHRRLHYYAIEQCRLTAGAVNRVRDSNSSSPAAGRLAHRNGKVAQVNVALEVTYDLVRFLSSLLLRGFPFQRTVVSRRRNAHSSACSSPLAL